MKMEYRKVGFAAGLRWLPAAAEMMAGSIVPLTGMAALWLGVSLIGLVPLMGPVALALIAPLLTAGALLSCATCGWGRAAAPMMLFWAWGQPRERVRLMLLGAVAIAAFILISLIVAGWLEGQLTAEQIEAAAQSPEAMAQLIEQLKTGWPVFFAALLAALAMGALYFAVPIVAFANNTPGRAMGLSLSALATNFAAFLGLGLAMAATLLAAGLLFMIVALVIGIGLGTAGAFIVELLVLVAAMLAQVLMAGVKWVAFSAIFGRRQGTGEIQDENQDNHQSDQLLA